MAFFKLAGLIFNQLNHSLLKCKLSQFTCIVFFFTEAPPKSSISTSEPILSLQQANARAHTKQIIPNQKIYLKRIHISENIVNICINDFSYLPANNQDAFYYLTRGLSTAPADITTIVGMGTETRYLIGLGAKL